MTKTPELAVRNDPEAGQYELFYQGAPVGLAQYQASPTAVAFVHTEISPEVGGRGFGKILVKAALDDVRRRGLAALPYCTFVRHFIEEHPQYLDLVPAARRRAFALPPADAPERDPQVGGPEVGGA
ncbi:MAG: N-acetyltransferase [Bifidobacteriaceae bacterium]|jgi:predicted GNAT family acetyltransferase|nr:N-acetyltransferase [Bifidobacteriaceae bacterium]